MSSSSNFFLIRLYLFSHFVGDCGIFSPFIFYVRLFWILDNYIFDNDGCSSYVKKKEKNLLEISKTNAPKFSKEELFKMSLLIIPISALPELQPLT